MRRKLIVAASTFILAASSAWTMTPNDPVGTSLVALLANPSAFDGRKVRVDGFLTLEFEGSALHLDRAAYEGGLRRNAVWVDSPPWLTGKDRQRLDRRYVELLATFDAAHRGHGDLYSGRLLTVERVVPLPTQEQFEREKLAAWLSFYWPWVVGFVVLAAMMFLSLRRMRR